MKMRCGKNVCGHYPNASQRPFQNWKPNVPEPSHSQYNAKTENDETVNHKNYTTQTNDTPAFEKDSSVISIQDSDSANTSVSERDEYGLEKLEKEMRLLLSEQMAESQSRINNMYKRKGRKPKRRSNAKTKNSLNETRKKAAELA